MDYINKNLYIISTVIFVLITAIFLLLSWCMQRKNLRRIFNTRNIALVALLSALGVALNIVGKLFTVVGAPIYFGNIIVFVIGMTFGPMMGMTSGIVVDLISSAIGFTGYHFGFTMAAALFGFAGSLVFLWKNNKWIIAKTVLTFGIYYLVYTFVISPISVAALFGTQIGGLYTISKLIRTPIELAIYLPLTAIVFEVLIQLIQHRLQKKSFIWALRKGHIHFKKKKSMYEKQLEKEKLSQPLSVKTKHVNKADKYITK